MAFNPDGGGGGLRVGQLLVNPDGNISFGSVAVGQNSTQQFIVSNVGTGTLTVTSITLTNGSIWTFSGLPTLPFNLGPQQYKIFSVIFTPLAATNYLSTLDLEWLNVEGDQPSYDIFLSGTGIVTGLAAWSPPNLAFPNTQENIPLTLNVNLQNQGSVPFSLTALTFTTGLVFSLVSPPSLPLTIVGGGEQGLTIQFAPTVIGAYNDTLTATTDIAGDPALPITGIATLLPIAICVNNIRAFLLAGFGSLGIGTPSPTPQLVLPLNLNSNQDSIVIFNGAIWQGMGTEKTLMKIGIYYENLGQTGVAIQLTVFRPTQEFPNGNQVYNYTESFGTASADNSVRYAEVDATATGEMIFMQLTRTGGPLSICAIVPLFEPRGEKVRNV